MLNIWLNNGILDVTRLATTAIHYIFLTLRFDSYSRYEIERKTYSRSKRFTTKKRRKIYWSKRGETGENRGKTGIYGENPIWRIFEKCARCVTTQVQQEGTKIANNLCCTRIMCLRDTSIGDYSRLRL